MNLSKRKYLRFLFLFQAFLLAGSSPSWATVSARCIEFLLSVRHLHSIGSLSQGSSSRAYEHLLRFRKTFAGEDESPSSKPVTANFQSSPKRQRAVLARINGLMHDYFNTGASAEGQEQKVILGSSFGGLTAIETQMENHQNVAQEIRELEGEASSLTSLFRRKYLYLFTAEIALLIFSAGIFTLGAPLFASLLALSVSMDTVKVVDFGLGEWREYEQLFQERVYQTTNSAASLEKGQWHYHSADILLHKALIDRTLTTGLVHYADLSLHWTANIDQRLSFKEIAQRFLRPLGLAGPDTTTESTSTWMHLDHVLFYDEEKNEPVYVIFIRFSKKRPVYPARVKERSFNPFKRPVFSPGGNY